MTEKQTGKVVITPQRLASACFLGVLLPSGKSDEAGLSTPHPMPQQAKDPKAKDPSAKDSTMQQIVLEIPRVVRKIMSRSGRTSNPIRYAMNPSPSCSIPLLEPSCPTTYRSSKQLPC